MVAPVRYIAAVTWRDGATTFRIGLRYIVAASTWRFWIARRAFRFGAWILGAGFDLEAGE